MSVFARLIHAGRNSLAMFSFVRGRLVSPATSSWIEQIPDAVRCRSHLVCSPTCAAVAPQFPQTAVGETRQTFCASFAMRHRILCTHAKNLRMALLGIQARLARRQAQQQQARLPPLAQPAIFSRESPAPPVLNRTSSAIDDLIRFSRDNLANSIIRRLNLHLPPFHLPALAEFESAERRDSSRLQRDRSSAVLVLFLFDAVNLVP